MNQVLPAPGPADVGIVLALPIEADPIRELLHDVRTYSDPEGTHRAVTEGMLGQTVVALIVSGVGRSLAAKGARRLIGGHRPKWLLSAGFAGALDPALRRNDLVFPTEILDATRPDDPPLAIPFTPPQSPPDATVRFASGRLLTAPKIVRTAAEKAALHARFAAVAVDMESAAVAAVCAERGQRFLAVRVISDEADTDLPPEVLSVLGPTGGFRLGATLGALMRRPSSIKDLWGLREHAVEASDRLAEILPGIIAQLP